MLPARPGARRGEEPQRRQGKSAGGREVRDLKGRILETIDAVLDGSQDRGRAAIAIQGFNALRGVLELERRTKESEELERRLEELEKRTLSRGGRRWG